MPDWRRALEEPDTGTDRHIGWDDLPAGTKLYTAPPKREWVGLTGNEVATLCMAFTGQFHKADFARAVEAKLKEKNGG